MPEFVISVQVFVSLNSTLFYNKTNVAANALNTKKPKTVTIQKEYDVQYKYITAIAKIILQG